MSDPANRRIVLGVTGGIAAYKSADLVRRLRERDCEVRVVMTAGGREFVTPLTMQALSGHAVHTDLLDPAAEAAMGHIELARWAELVAIAPASADFLARLAHGLADDLLSTLCLATTAPIVLAPAMNHQMWAAQATQANRRLLAERGVMLLGPGEGSQACGEVGPGRMLDPLDIADAVVAHPALRRESGALANLAALITAGPTREAIDPVRYISNRSSGKMGYALARAAAEAGARVTLVSGPTCLRAPPGVERIAVTSAAEMYAAVMERTPATDVFIGAAAVADYRPREAQQAKIKKGAEHIELRLVRTPDILGAVAGRTGSPFTVGFAAETEDLERNARDKLERKLLDMVAANLVGGEGTGFDSDENALSVFWAGGGRELARAPKERLARELVALVGERYRAKNSAPSAR